MAATVRTLGYDPVSQDDFPTGQGELRRWLFEQIDASEGLIQLAGEAYGAEPPDVDPAWCRVSYTQLEFLYARQQGKKTWLIVMGDEFPRDHPLAQLDLPDDLDPVEAAKEQAVRRALQRDYLKRLKQDNHLRHTAGNQTELDNVVLRLRDELAELREAEKERWTHLDSRLDEIKTGVESEQHRRRKNSRPLAHQYRRNLPARAGRRGHGTRVGNAGAAARGCDGRTLGTSFADR